MLERGCPLTWGSIGNAALELYRTRCCLSCTDIKHAESLCAECSRLKLVYSACEAGSHGRGLGKEGCSRGKGSELVVSHSESGFQRLRLFVPEVSPPRGANGLYLLASRRRALGRTRQRPRRHKCSCKFTSSSSTRYSLSTIRNMK